MFPRTIIVNPIILLFVFDHKKSGKNDDRQND